MRFLDAARCAGFSSACGGRLSFAAARLIKQVVGYEPKPHAQMKDLETAMFGEAPRGGARASENVRFLSPSCAHELT